jgi:hypothetical protein
MDIFSYLLGRKSGGGGSPGGGGGGGGSTEEWIGDGNTHIWISLQEGRTSPVLGIGVRGTVTIDWGDGSTPDVLTGTSTSTVKWTPNHEYAKAGDYVVTLSVEGTAGIIGSSKGTYLLAASSSDADNINYVYRNAIQKIEIGIGVTNIDSNAFYNCYSLASVVISDSVTSIGSNAFSNCSSLASVVIPDSVTSIGSKAFQNCYSLASVVISDSVTSIGSNAFQNCMSLASVVISDSVTSIGASAFQNCMSLASVVISDSVTSIGASAFQNCMSLASVVIPDGVTSIGGYAFYNCYSVAYYDFSNHTTVPTLSATSAFDGMPADCKIRVPAALVDEWKAATNWATYASYIVGV